jgi:hypothetical protein
MKGESRPTELGVQFAGSDGMPYAKMGSGRDDTQHLLWRHLAKHKTPADVSLATGVN